ncbi:hypothetical protein NDU88_002151 [Pleurodeles waltl]|uniref:Uncharacterized protein n=1 Tax=Pleurodeles waltl TaxID=8319 RepID=A0AAV7RA38_PLEWA|nr:hypothetical protein NDU88_002151 [Pleurodeles waltl]
MRPPKTKNREEPGQGPKQGKPLQQKQPENRPKNIRKTVGHTKKPRSGSNREPRGDEEETSQQPKKRVVRAEHLPRNPRARVRKQRHQPWMGTTATAGFKEKTQLETGSNRDQAKEPHTTKRAFKGPLCPPPRRPTAETEEQDRETQEQVLR